LASDGITITVTDRQDVDWIRSKVTSGGFASETDVVAHGIAMLREEDAQLETWLRGVIANRYDRHKEHPETAIPAEKVAGELDARRRRRLERSQ
jgi:antitoxin ParD1/3/4